MKRSNTFIIAIILILIAIGIFYIARQENYTKFCAKNNQPGLATINKKMEKALAGGLCIGTTNSHNSDQLSFNVYRDADDFDSTGGELKSKYTKLSVSAYSNANADGNPLEYTDKWRGQKFAFDVQGTDNGRNYGVIRHVDSGRCLHPEGGTPDSTGQRIVTWGGCTPEDRIMYVAY